MSKCDTVIFLDYPADVCLSGIRARRGKQRTDIPWIETEEDPEFMNIAAIFNDNRRPQILMLLERYNDKNIVIFKSREESAEFLRGLEN